MNTKKTLEKSGLSSKEAAVYVALLELGDASAQRIAKRAGLKRPTTYVALQSLLDRGLVRHVKRGKILSFAAQHPRKMVTESELRLEELRAAMPQLESLFSREEERPRISLFEEKENLGRAFDDWFMEGGEILYLGTPSLSLETFPEAYRKMGLAKWGPEGISARELIPYDDAGEAYAKGSQSEYRTIRFMPSALCPFETDIAVFGNNVLITSVKKSYFTVRIESADIANAFRKMFDALWELGRE